MARWLNTVGLLLAMLGVVILFKWGPPQPSFRAGGIVVTDEHVFPNGKTQAQKKSEAVADEKRYRKFARLGLFLIFCGFVFQLAAAWLPGEKCGASLCSAGY